MYIHTQTGGKKGVEISGAADMGGLDFFNTQLEQCKGKVNLLEMAMHAMNKDIDPAEEESKGGSAATGKLLLSAGDTEMAVVAYVPADKQGKVRTRTPSYTTVLVERLVSFHQSS